MAMRKGRSRTIQALYKNIDEQHFFVSARLRTIVSYRKYLKEWQMLFHGLNSFANTASWFDELHSDINECEEIIDRCVRDDNFGSNGMIVQLSEYIYDMPNCTFCGLSRTMSKDAESCAFMDDVEVLLERLVVDLEESFNCFGRIMTGSSEERELNLHKPFCSTKLDS